MRDNLSDQFDTLLCVLNIKQVRNHQGVIDRQRDYACRDREIHFAVGPFIDNIDFGHLCSECISSPTTEALLDQQNDRIIVLTTKACKQLICVYKLLAMREPWLFQWHCSTFVSDWIVFCKMLLWLQEFEYNSVAIKYVSWLLEGRLLHHPSPYDNKVVDMHEDSLKLITCYCV